MTIDGGRIVVQIEGRDVNLTQLLQRVQVQMNSGIAAARNYDTAMAQISPTQRRLEADNIAYAQSLARAAVASGDLAGAQRILASAIAQVTPNTIAANNALAQLQTITNKATASSSESNGIFTEGANALGKLIGVYFIATQAAQAFYSVIQTGNEQEKTLTTFKALSGSAENYEKNLAIAREQQAKFGGSLTDTVEGMTEFANLATRTGVNIASLTNLARGLAVIDPAQGFKGAGIALKEFFSGNVTSLSRRFEIPKEVLNSLNKISDPIEKFQKLQEALQQFGITQELVNSQSATTAATFDRMSGAFDDAKAAIGRYVAVGPQVKFLTNIFREVESGISTLSNAPEKLRQFQLAIIQAGGSIDQMNQKVNNSNAQIGALAPHIQQISAAQVQYVQSLQSQGASQDTISQKLESTSGLMDKLTAQMQAQGGVQETIWNGGRAKVTAYQSALLTLAGTSDVGAAAANSYAIAVSNNALSIEQATVLANQYMVQLTTVQATSDAATNATQTLNLALYDNAAAGAITSAQNDLLQRTQQQVYNAAEQAVAGTSDLGAAAVALAARLQIPINKARELISVLAQIGVKDHAAYVAENRDDLKGARNNAAAPKPLSQAFLEDQKKRNEALVESEVTLAKARKDDASALKLLDQQQSHFAKGSAEYNKIEAQKIDIANSGKKKGSGDPKLTANEKLNNALAAQDTKFNDKEEDEAAKHYKKLLDIYNDYAQKLADQQKKNETSKRSSRVSFYDNNKDLGKGVDPKKYAAEYEEAFRKAQEVAQQGKAKLAEDYLALRQRQIEEDRKLASEEAEIREDKDLTKKEKDAAIEYLNGRKKLLADLHAEEEKALLEGGDALQKERDQQLSDEENAYAEHADKIQLSADRAMRAKIQASVNARKAIEQENKALLDQQHIYQSIIGTGNNSTPSAGGVSPANTGTNTSVPITTDQPIPITSDVLLVKQAEMFNVLDSASIEVLNSTHALLDDKLSQVADNIKNSTSSIVSSIESLNSSIKRSAGSCCGSSMVSP